MAVLAHRINAFCRDYIAVGPDGTRRCDTEGFKGLSLQDMINALADECGIVVDMETGMLTIPDIEVVKKEGAADDGTAETETTAG